ncbi:hypothetical protein Tco_0159193 [Tanacetum coccineum]
MRHHTLYGVKPLLLYAATFKFTRDDLSESALRRNIDDKTNVIPYKSTYFKANSNPGAVMLTRAIAKELSAASAHECLFVDSFFEEPKKVFETLKHLGWVDAMQEELN